MCHLHVSVVLLCSAYGAFSCSLVFKVPHPYPPLFLYFIFYIVFYIGSPLFFQFSVTGAGAGAGSWVFWLLGFGFSSSSPPPPPAHVPGHPTSICDEGVNSPSALFRKFCVRLSHDLTKSQERLTRNKFHIIHT